MSSLRFDGAVKSARRQRALDQRVAANAAAAGIIDSQLQKLAARDELPTDLPTDPEEEDFYQCSLTFADMPEIMGDTIDDVIGFALCVQRPEEVVDAPSLIRVHGISTTLLTRSALLDAIKFKLDATDQVGWWLTSRPSECKNYSEIYVVFRLSSLCTAATASMARLALRLSGEAESRSMLGFHFMFVIRTGSV